MTDILLVDDDARIRAIIREYSLAEDWNFLEAGSGEEALAVFDASKGIDLVVLDIMMPKLDGWNVLKQIRKTNRVPVILLSARDEEYDRLLGFELGADDYLGKPFSPRELVARIKALLKRSGNQAETAEIFTHETLIVDLNAHTVKLDGESVALTPKEYDLLAFLITHPGKVFAREQMLSRVWGYDYFGDSRTVDTHIKSLREKLGVYRDIIATVRGAGYRFDGGAK